MQRTLSVHHELPSLAPVEQALAAVGMHAVRTDETAAEQATKLSIQAMDCPTEEALIRAKLVDVPGVSDLDFNLVQRTLTVHHASGVLPNVLAALKTIDFDARVIEPAETSDIPAPAQTKWWPLAISGVTAVAAEIMYWLHDGNHWSVMTLALIAILTGGLPTYKKGWIALKNRNLNMNALMSIAVTGAVLIGHWPEAAMVMVLFALAEVIEAKSLDRARNAIRGLMDLTPERATVRQPDGTWNEVDAKQIAIGSQVRVKPGERIALDGEVVEGRSTVNQAPITGESIPVEKAPGDQVFAGTINESGSFRVSRYRGCQQFDPGAHHSRRGSRPGQPCAYSTFRRSVRSLVYAHRVRGGACCRRLSAAFSRSGMARLGLPRAGSTGDRLPVRAGHFHPRQHCQRPGCRNTARHSCEGRRISGRGSKTEMVGARQNRNRHPWQTSADRFHHLARCRS